MVEYFECDLVEWLTSEIFCCRYGRRIIILVNLASQAIFGVAAAFAPNFYIYTALRFMVGTSISGVIMNAFVLGQCPAVVTWKQKLNKMLNFFSVEVLIVQIKILISTVCVLSFDQDHQLIWFVVIQRNYKEGIQRKVLSHYKNMLRYLYWVDWCGLRTIFASPSLLWR